MEVLVGQFHEKENVVQRKCLEYGYKFAAISTVKLDEYVGGEDRY